MKQAEIVTGESYLFYRTNTEHKKDMIGTIVKIVGCRKSKTKSRVTYGGIQNAGNKPVRYKLDNGRYANSSELNPLN